MQAVAAAQQLQLLQPQAPYTGEGKPFKPQHFCLPHLQQQLSACTHSAVSTAHQSVPQQPQTPPQTQLDKQTNPCIFWCIYTTHTNTNKQINQYIYVYIHRTHTAASIGSTEAAATRAAAGCFCCINWICCSSGITCCSSCSCCSTCIC